MTADELERLLSAQFGPDFREKVIVDPLGSFALRDAFEECGVRDPQAAPASFFAYGLYQFAR